MPVLEEPRVVARRTTSIKKWGTSQAIRIPKAVCEELEVGIGTELVLEYGADVDGPYLLIRSADKGHRSFADAPFVSMDEAFEGYAGDYVPREADWGADVGAEAVA